MNIRLKWNVFARFPFISYLLNILDVEHYYSIRLMNGFWRQYVLA